MSLLRYLLKLIAHTVIWIIWSIFGLGRSFVPKGYLFVIRCIYFIQKCPLKVLKYFKVALESEINPKNCISEISWLYEMKSKHKLRIDAVLIRQSSILKDKFSPFIFTNKDNMESVWKKKQSDVKVIYQTISQ